MSVPRHPEFFRTFNEPKTRTTLAAGVAAAVLTVIAVALVVGLTALLPSALIMLALGVLHHEASSAIPALGFGATFLVVYGVSAVVTVLRGGTRVNTSQTTSK